MSSLSTSIFFVLVAFATMAFGFVVPRNQPPHFVQTKLHATRSNARSSGTKLSFLSGAIEQDLLQDMLSIPCEEHYFEPMTGKAIHWNDAHDANKVLLKKSYRQTPLHMESPKQQVKEIQGDCGDNFYFDPITGEAVCWSM